MSNTREGSMMGKRRTSWAMGIAITCLAAAPATATQVPFTCEPVKGAIEGYFTPEHCPSLEVVGPPVRGAAGGVAVVTVRVVNHGSRTFAPAIHGSVGGRGMSLAPSPAGSSARRQAVAAYRAALARHRAAPTAVTLATLQRAIRVSNYVTKGVDGFRPMGIVDRTGGAHVNFTGGVIAPGRSAAYRWRWRVDPAAAVGRRNLTVSLRLPFMMNVERTARVPLIVMPAPTPPVN